MRARLFPFLLLLAGCGGSQEDGPRWIHLAGDVRLEPTRLESGTKIHVTPQGRDIYLVRDEESDWLETSIAKEDWKADAKRSLIRADVGFVGTSKARMGKFPYQLLVDGSEYEYVSRADRENARLPENGFAVTGTKVLVGADLESWPDEVRFRTAATLSRPEDGLDRVTGRRISGEGFSVLPGESLRARVTVPPASALRFATCAESAWAPPSKEPVRFRLLADGAELLEHELFAPREGSYAWHTVPLPSGDDVELAFEVEGAFAYTSFLAPVIGPLETGAYEDRPWGASRPHIVLFLADTFRADNLATFGGPDDLAPNIDRFAEGCLRFPRAWSTCTFTLPSHASMLSGLFPHQSWMQRSLVSLPDSVVTIAEHLAESGYRTGAITESGWVSSAFGLDQGFEWFHERWQAGMPSMLRRTRDFLEADDGRPLFLFVQTYRVHSPYKVSDETRRRLGDVPDESYRELLEILQQDPAYETDPRSSPTVVETTDKLRRLYRASVIDLDAGFAELVENLTSLGVLEDGYLVFTSDHGEAFLEHDEVFHHGKVYEEQIRIPLLIRGPDLTPATIEHGASLVDLPGTLAAMAGVRPYPQWMGASLLTLDRDRPIFAFQCRPDIEQPTLAIIDGERKLLGFEAPGSEAARLWAAHDLARDPREQENLLGKEAWPEVMLERYWPVVQTLLTPVVGSEAAAIDAEHLDELRAMGYLGD